jgi:hypothetical protein
MMGSGVPLPPWCTCSLKAERWNVSTTDLPLKMDSKSFFNESLVKFD